MKQASSMVGLAGAIAALLIAVPLAAQDTGETIPLYAGTPPGMIEGSTKESRFDVADSRFTSPNPDTLVINVKVPTLTIVRPAAGRTNGTAVVIAPGGGFRVLSYRNEGTRVARYLADRGVTCFILKYRLHDMPGDPAAVMRGLDLMAATATTPLAGAAAAPPPPMPPMGPVEAGAIGDGEAAIRLVRGRATAFGIDPAKIGILGFSAGGVVAGGAATRMAAGERPAFAGIIYGFVPGIIPRGAPPAFMAAAADDPLSVGMPDLFGRWRAAGASAELHIFAKGQHGFATARQNLPVDHWLDQFHAWLGQQGFVAALGGG